MIGINSLAGFDLLGWSAFGGAGPLEVVFNAKIVFLGSSFLKLGTNQIVLVV